MSSVPFPPRGSDGRRAVLPALRDRTPRRRRSGDSGPRWWALDPRLMTRLISTPEGWALVSYSGETVFHAEGRDARRRCLLRAYALGVQCMTR